MKNDKEKLKKTDGDMIASPGRRFGGWVVDFLLWLMTWSGLVWLIVSAGDVAKLLDSLLWAIIGSGILGTLGNLALTAGFTHWFGGTVGKLAFGMEVVDEQGNRLSFWRAVWREWFGAWVSSAALWLGFIWIFIDKDRRGWHDMMAGSKVVMKRNFLAVGFLTLAILLAINLAMAAAIRDTLESNQSLYQQIIQDIGGG